MSISIVGIGIGDTKYLTQAARDKIDNADIIIGAKRVTEPFSDGKKVYFEYEAKKIADILRDAEYENAAVLFSGDASFYSGAKRLMEIFPEAEVSPGISSVSYFCSKIRQSYDDMNIISLHGRKCNIVSEVRRNKKTFALLGENPCKKLCEYGLGTVKVWIGENLSYENETVRAGTAEDFCDTQLSPLSVMVIESENADCRMRIGIDDSEFVQGGTPMTKSSVRAVTISKLEIKPDDICYDIGAGTGSVSVEMALAAYRGTVYAIEKKSDAADLIKQNAVKFKTDNIEVIEGSAPDVLCGLPKPDKVFIGGSSGTLKQTIEKCGCDHIVVNAITLETLEGTLKAFNKLGYDYEIVQISAAYAKKVATYNMMTAQNPVFIITGKRGK
ncbi:MAG: precorrin-6y C5,15-methyltransferase (decarboxylating) subunit CbiE [Clostridia bacterium]|nr:precorrin-6y C5,15-methyltransferase (decarboxylating) subunit CbiE [Clostridia bacterium]